MSNHDYTKYSKTTDEKIEETPITIEEDEETPVVTEEPAPVVTEEPAPVVKGKVVNCAKLNVRNEATLNSKVLCEILHNSEVEIDESESTDDFYKVITVTGVEGFCKKDYIAISQ